MEQASTHSRITLCLLMCAALALMSHQDVLANSNGAARRVQLAEADAFREFGYIGMKDGVSLAYVVWRPKKRGRFPTIFHYGPYDNDAQSFDDVRSFLEAGYAFLGVNMRGTGCSEGVDREGGVM